MQILFDYFRLKWYDYHNNKDTRGRYVIEQTLSKIRSLSDTLGRGERKIAGWLLENPSELISMSISEVASVCGCGDAISQAIYATEAALESKKY